MKKFLLLLGMVVALAVPSAAMAVEDDPGSGATCNSVNLGQTIWHYGPVYGWHYYQCQYRQYSPDYFVWSNGAYWVQYTYGPTWYYVNIYAFFPV